MAPFIAFDYWLKSPRRAELAAGYEGMTMRTFVDPGGSNRTGVIIEVPDHLVPMFQEMAQTEESIEAAKADGVRSETAVILVEA